MLTYHFCPLSNPNSPIKILYSGCKDTHFLHTLQIFPRFFTCCLAIVCLYTVIFLPRKEKFARKRVNFRRFSLLYFRYVIQRESVENKLQKWICPICFCPICPTCLERDRGQVSVQRVIWTGTSVHSFGSMNQPLWFNKFARICSNLPEFLRHN